MLRVRCFATLLFVITCHCSLVQSKRLGHTANKKVSLISTNDQPELLMCCLCKKTESESFCTVEVQRMYHMAFATHDTCETACKKQGAGKIESNGSYKTHKTCKESHFSLPREVPSSYRDRMEKWCNVMADPEKMIRECTDLAESPLHPSDSIDQFSFKCKNINFDAKQLLGSGTFGMVLEYSISFTPDQGKEDSPIGQSVAIKIFTENEHAEIERTASEYVYKAFCEKEPVTRPWSGETEKKNHHHHLSSSMIPSFAISIDGFGTAIIMPQAMKSLEKEMQPEGQSGQQQYLITEFVNKRAALLGLPIAPTFVDEYVDYLRLRIGIDIFRDVLEQLQQISKNCDECAYTDLKVRNGFHAKQLVLVL